MIQAPSGDPSSSAPRLDPGRILGMMTAFEQTAALKAALSLGLFTAMARGADTAERLAQACDCAPRSARVLADVLCVLGLLAKSDSRYTLAPDAAAFLDEGSESYIGEAARFLASSEKIELYFGDTAGWARRGGPATQANVTPDGAVWVDFARGMAKVMAPAALGTAQALKARLHPEPERILDVAAGHGLFGVACLQAFAHARVTAMDWAAVLEVAGETSDAAGVLDRWRGAPGSAFDLDAPGGYDLVLVPNFLHHFEPAICVGFLVKAAAALRPGGAVAIVEYTPDESRVAPPVPALFALSMLTGTPSGDAYTAQELGAMCAAAGLASVAVEPIAATVQTLLIARHGPS